MGIKADNSIPVDSTLQNGHPVIPTTFDLSLFEQDTKESNRGHENSSYETIDHPQYYGGKNNPYEAIKVIEAWNLNFNLGNCLKYISRAGKKLSTGLNKNQKQLEDLKKASWYLNREVNKLQDVIKYRG